MPFMSKDTLTATKRRTDVLTAYRGETVRGVLRYAQNDILFCFFQFVAVVKLQAFAGKVLQPQAPFISSRKNIQDNINLNIGQYKNTIIAIKADTVKQKKHYKSAYSAFFETIVPKNDTEDKAIPILLYKKIKKQKNFK